MKMPTSRRGVGLGGLVFALAVSVSAAAEPPTRLERIDEQLTIISNFAINAKAKLANGVVGRPSEQNSGPRGSAALACCSTNVDRMQRSVAELRGIVGELEACYIDTAHEDATVMSGVFVTDLNSFSRGVDGFAESTTSREALGHLAALTRLYVIMSDSAKQVAECPVVAKPAEAGGEHGGDGAAKADGEHPQKKGQKKKKAPSASDDPGTR